MSERGDAHAGAAPLDLVVVGCGRVVERYHLPALRQAPEWSVIGACDPLRERRQWMRGQLERVPVLESFRDLVAACRPDAALVATPPSTHCEEVVRALEMGMHVLVEKPMALTAAEADRMWVTSLRAHKRLGIGFSRRFRSSYLELRERCARLPARDVELIRFDLVGNAAAWKAVTDFLGDDGRGGGVLDDMASHQLDLLPWLVRQRVSRVRARRQTVTEQRCERIAYEVEFDSGLTALCSVGHGAKRDETLQLVLRDRQLIAQTDRLFELRRRSAAWTRAYCRVRRLRDRVLGRRQESEDVVMPFVRQLRSFAAAVRNADGLDGFADGMSGAHTVRGVAACRESMRSGGAWVSVESSCLGG